MTLRNRILQSIAVIASASILAFFLSDNKAPYTPLPEYDDTVYTIGLFSPTTFDEDDVTKTGFIDAINDSIGESHIKIKTMQFKEDEDASKVCSNLINSGVDLIFAQGGEALDAASITSFSVPIVSCNVISIKNRLHISDDTWEGVTNRNITGVSSLTSISDQLSILIEATPDIESIGILYSPDDSDAIYQNEIMERYLTEAGIMWKEYDITLEEKTTDDEQEEPEVNIPAYIITPKSFVARSGKEGANTSIDSLGETNILSGILAPESIRIPKKSKNWNKRDISNDDLTYSEYIQTACDECDALFICAGSALAPIIDEIVEAANNTATTTLGGDSELGKSTLVSAYVDPYQQGYTAGKQAYRILVGNEDPGQITTGSLASIKMKKLYNKTVASIFSKEFPKSFSDVNSYLLSYRPGSNTVRLNSGTDQTESEE